MNPCQVRVLRNLVAATTLLASLSNAGLASAEDLARPNRFSASLGFGLASAPLDGFSDLVDDLRAAIEGQNGIELSGAPVSHLQIGAEFNLRYYLPYFVLLQSGFATLYNWSSATFDAGPVGGEVENHNLIMEVPFLVGGYYPLLGRLYVFGALGPTYFFFARSYWDVNPGDATDFKADGGVGFQALLGAEAVLAENFAVGLDLRYRMLNAGKIKELESDAIIYESTFLRSGERTTYDYDMSGFGAALHLRVFFL